jgi:hypothetical protein
MSAGSGRAARSRSELINVDVTNAGLKTIRSFSFVGELFGLAFDRDIDLNAVRDYFINCNAPWERTTRG